VNNQPAREKLDVKIRNMKRSDLHRVHLLETQIFSDAWPMQAFEDCLELDSEGVIVAEVKGEIVGYAAIITGYEESHLANIAVMPQFRGKSIAKKLLNCILDIARRAKSQCIFLDVRPSNLAAISLYEKFGFVELYRRPGYYRTPNEDALVMVKSLKEDYTDNGLV